jgi:hypothetical protein
MESEESVSQAVGSAPGGAVGLSAEDTPSPAAGFRAWHHQQPSGCLLARSRTLRGRMAGSWTWRGGRASRVQSPGNECGHGQSRVGLPTLLCIDQVPDGV